MQESVKDHLSGGRSSERVKAGEDGEQPGLEGNQQGNIQHNLGSSRAASLISEECFYNTQISCRLQFSSKPEQTTQTGVPEGRKAVQLEHMLQGLHGDQDPDLQGGQRRVSFCALGALQGC